MSAQTAIFTGALASPERLAAREALLTEVTQIPTAAGCEQRVHAWVEARVARLGTRVRVERDDAGNWKITRADAPLATAAPAQAPMFITAHLDHPAFVVTGVDADGTVALEFRGGVNDPYFVGAEIEFIGSGDARTPATITELDAKATPFKRVKAKAASRPAVGSIARWKFPRAEVIAGNLHTDACDDLAAVAAALCAFEELLDNPRAAHVGVLFTVAEEVGFVGAIHAARNGFVPRTANLICLENSRSFPHDSPIGAGAILRVGDRLSVFTPELTNQLAQAFAEEKKRDPTFAYQRKLMAGGACEATAFAAYGFRSTCLCLPLGNYHNMVDIDGVAAGTAPASVGREYISIRDFHSLCRMLHIAALPHDASSIEPYDALMERLYGERRQVLGPALTQAPTPTRAAGG